MRPSSRLLWIVAATWVVAALPMIVNGGLWPIVFATWGALVIAGVFDLWALLRARPIVEIHVPAAVGVGSPLAIKIQATLRGPWHLKTRVRAEVAAPLATGADLNCVLRPGANELSLAVRADRRGTGIVWAVWLALESPLGLLLRQRRVEVSDANVAVLPNVARVRSFALEHFGAWQYKGGLRIARQAGDGTELDALEAYQPGMDPRAIDWKTSARHQALRVRRYRLEQNQRLVLCYDVGRLMGDPIEGLTRLDHAIHAGLLISHAALRGGDLVGLHAYARAPTAWVPPAVGARRLRGIVDACAGLHSSIEETNHVLGLHDLLGKVRRRSLVVVFSEFADSTTAELMVENLGQLARKHLVVFVAFDDPVVEEALSHAPTEMQDLAAAVVAGGLRQDRQRVLRRLRRSGVNVVHGPPTQATLGALRSYIRIKRRGLIG